MTPALPTISDKTVREVLRGLIALAFFIWGGIFAIYFHWGRVEPSMLVAATGISGGLVGIVSLRHGPDTTSNVDAPSATSVTVSQPGPTPAVPPVAPVAVVQTPAEPEGAG